MPLSGLVPELGPIHSFVHSPGVLGFGDTEISKWGPDPWGDSARRET